MTATACTDNPQVVKIITLARDSGGRNLLVTALESKSVPIVGALVELIDGYKVATEQVTNDRVKQKMIRFLFCVYMMGTGD